MGDSILICVPQHGGCGHFDWSTKWDKDGDFLFCPICGQDHTCQLVYDNFYSLTVELSEKEKQQARELLNQYYKNQIHRIVESVS